MINFNNSNADLFVPDNVPDITALKRTTHLAIASHQDDVEIMAYHGIAECFKQETKWFSALVVTNGEGSPRAGSYASLSPTELAQTRKEEQRRAALIGEYSAAIQLGYSSASIKGAGVTDVREDIDKILRIARPNTVYLHSPTDRHDTHVAVFVHAMEVLRCLPAELRPRTVYGCEVWGSLDWLTCERRLSLPTEKFPHLSASLLGVFDSQISAGKHYELAAIGRWRANATFWDYRTIDEFLAVAVGLDLSPLVRDDSLAIRDYVADLIESFRAGVFERLERFLS